MVFDVYILYAYVGVISAFIIGTILNRTRATVYKNTIDKKLCSVFIFFIIFCFFDACWGIIGSQLAPSFPLLYIISSYAFHMLAAFSSVFCSWYAVYYFGFKPKTQKILYAIRITIFAGQMALLLQNIWTNSFFLIDSEGVYHAGFLRRPAFYLQFLQYTPFAVYALVIAIKEWANKKKRNLHLLGFFFLLVPLLFGVLQMFYPDGPFYSLGFAVFSVAIYSISVTAQREEYLADYSRLQEQKQSQESIQQALNAAKEANNVKSKFLANMSHDIRTPINGVLGIVELAKDEKDSKKLHEYIEKIDNTSHHLLSLVNDVLDMALIENKQDSLLNEEPTSIFTIIDNCQSIISGQLIHRDIYFNVSYDGKITQPNIMVDQLRLKQILINVLGNAIKFTRVGGIDFVIKQTKASSEMVEFKFTIKDTGIGMSKEFISHIFEPFQQENNANARTKYQGTGLGMSITKSLVDIMHGNIEITSVANEGSTFFITIPFKISSSPVKNKMEDAKEYSIEGLKILLAEDNELNMEIAKTILEKNGAIVTDASDGQIAVETFTNSNIGAFDLILMDIMMPNLNGYEATGAIRKLDREDAKTIPIIAMTANADDESKKEAIASGMNGHIAKPIDFSNLSKMIRNILGDK